MFQRIGELARDLKKHNLPCPFGSWDIVRSYTPHEIRNARLFMLRLPPTHMAAEEYGSEYDESSSCTQCGAGARQVGPLRIHNGKLPRSRDIIQLWGGELLISGRATSLIREQRISGYSVRPLAASRRYSTIRSAPYSHLIITSRPVQLANDLAFCEHPFDTESRGRCACGNIAGLQLLSRLSVDQSSWDGDDFAQTDVFIGSRAGLFRPSRLLLISKRCFELFRLAKIKGYRFEIVELA